MAGFCNLANGLRATGFALCQANSLKVSGHDPKYSRL